MDPLTVVLALIIGAAASLVGGALGGSQSAANPLATNWPR
jgi:hypothetical protein